MMEALSVLLILAGSGFFFAGSVGLLRLPELLSRLHALTKADNLGLGLITAGVALQAPDLLVAAKLVLVWFAAILSAATTAQLLATHELRDSHDEGGQE